MHHLKRSNVGDPVGISERDSEKTMNDGGTRRKIISICLTVLTQCRSVTDG